MVVVEGGEVWFAKNSDRDPNEGQSIRWYAARDHEPGAMARCTWREIPQVLHTHALMLSQPFWMWGAEMGANEHGLVIGNEAVFTDQPLEADGLTGMCLLRLALERASSASEAVEVICSLVEAHGQGGRCGLEDPGFCYSSSFLIADPSGAFVLETAGRKWATERVVGARSISNGLTLPALAARHADPLRTRVACAAKRASRTASLARASWPGMAAALRDHGGEPWPRYDALTGTLGLTCMHGGGLVASSQTTASWISRLTPGGAEHRATGTSSPCLSLFKPIDLRDPLDLGPTPADRHDPSSFFWQAERVHRAVLRAPERLAPSLVDERDRAERRWASEPPAPAAAWEEHRRLLASWQERLDAGGADDQRPLWARAYWQKRERLARSSFSR